MTTMNLLNIAVEITVSDPWEFGTECGVGPFSGRVVEQRSDAVSVKLDVPLPYAGRRLASVVIRARHVGDSLAHLGHARHLAANFVFAPSDIVSLAPGADTGIAAIGSVRLK